MDYRQKFALKMKSYNPKWDIFLKKNLEQQKLQTLKIKKEMLTQF